MATKTVIIRPRGTRVGSNAEATNESVPTTKAGDLWRLIDEAVADDDATYFKMDQYTWIYFSIPDEYSDKIPTSIKVHSRVRASADGTYTIKLCTVELSSNANVTTSYETTNFSVPTDNITSVYSSLLTSPPASTTSDITSTLTISPNSTGDNKNTINLYITQAYLELTYDVEGGATPDVIYINENGAWTSFSGQVYKKTNGAWVEADAAALANGTKYIVNKT